VPKGQLALGYRWLDDKWVEQPLLHDGAYGAMGGLITTIEDFSKYMAVHMNAWPARDDAEMARKKEFGTRDAIPVGCKLLNGECKNHNRQAMPYGFCLWLWLALG
jgi:hypothetical protein